MAINTTLALSNLTTTSEGIDGVLLIWANDTDGCLTYTGQNVVEVWRAATNDRSQASKLAEVEGNSYTDTGFATRQTFYYWVRAKNASGELGLWEPSGSTSGIAGTPTTQDPDGVRSDLNVEDGATDGANFITNLLNIPDRITDNATTGLNITDSFMGYFDGFVWQVFIRDNGNFQFRGNSSNFIAWDGASLDIRGTLTVENPSGVRADINVENGADVTGSNTALDTSSVAGSPATTVRDDASEARTFAGNVASDTTFTTIDGGSITTGTIDASQATIINLDAANITTGTLSADTINAADQLNIGNPGIFAGFGDLSVQNIVVIGEPQVIVFTKGVLNCQEISARKDASGSGGRIVADRVSINDDPVSGNDAVNKGWAENNLGGGDGFGQINTPSGTAFASGSDDDVTFTNPDANINISESSNTIDFGLANNISVPSNITAGGVVTATRFEANGTAILSTTNSTILSFDGSTDTLAIGPFNTVDLVEVTANLDVSGSFTATSKNFRIPHPLKEGYDLVHATVESDTPGENLYRYQVKSAGNKDVETLQIPAYIPALNDDFQVFVSPADNFGSGFGWMGDGVLHYRTNEAGTYNILLIGTRQDLWSSWKGPEQPSRPKPSFDEPEDERKPQ